MSKFIQPTFVLLTFITIYIAIGIVLYEKYSY